MDRKAKHPQTGKWYTRQDWEKNHKPTCNQYPCEAWPTTHWHILWSRDIDALDIHCPSEFRLGNDAWNLQECKRGQLAYIESLQREMESKKRKDTLKQIKSAKPKEVTP